MLNDDAWMVSPAPVYDKQGSSLKYIDKSIVNNCSKCFIHFSIVIKKHNCRDCGLVFCGSCSSMKDVIKKSKNVRLRLCNECNEKFNSKTNNENISPNNFIRNLENEVDSEKECNEKLEDEDEEKLDDKLELENENPSNDIITLENDLKSDEIINEISVPLNELKSNDKLKNNIIFVAIYVIIIFIISKCIETIK